MQGTSLDVSLNNGERLSKGERLRKRREFLLVQREGKKIHLQNLLVFVFPRQGPRRIGITVSSKVGKAVIRNRLKRRMREIWRRQRDTIPHGYDVVFVVKKTGNVASYQSLSRQVMELGRKMSHGRQI